MRIQNAGITTPKLVKDLADESGQTINIVKIKIDEAEREVNKRIMWEPDKYRNFLKQSGHKLDLVKDVARDLLGISSVSPGTPSE